MVLFKILFIRMMGSFSRGVLKTLGQCSEPGTEESTNTLQSKVLRLSGFKNFIVSFLIKLSLRQGHDAV